MGVELRKPVPELRVFKAKAPEPLVEAAYLRIELRSHPEAPTLRTLKGLSSILTLLAAAPCSSQAVPYSQFC